MSKDSTSISMKDISFQYDSKIILENFNLDIEHGKIYALIGSSGSGKTTTLRLMNGLLEPQKGSLTIDDKPFDFKQGEKTRRTMGYSIQGAGLFPHMTIEENLSVIAKREGWSKQKIQQRIKTLCELVNLPYEKTFLNKKSREISGGQQQRVGIARALFMSPKIILMDEPFSALDPITRAEVQKEFLVLQKKLSLTIVLVTHDLPEAFTMAHQIVLLNEGKIEQNAKPSHFLLKPETEYVKKFMESHSPGNLLKEIYLYSVMNSDVYTAIQESSSIKLRNLDSLEVIIFSNTNEVQEFLTTKNQDTLYWINHEGELLFHQTFSEKQLSEKNSISLCSTDHILCGMKKIISSQLFSIPVINNNKMVGVFSRGALDAL